MMVLSNLLARLNIQTICWFNRTESISNLPHQESVWFNLWVSSPSLHLVQTEILLSGLFSLLIKASPLQLAATSLTIAIFQKSLVMPHCSRKSNIIKVTSQSHKHATWSPLLLFGNLYTTHHNWQMASRFQCLIPAKTPTIGEPSKYRSLYVMIK